MKLTKLLNGALSMQAYEMFVYQTILPYDKSKIKPEESEDQKLAESIIENFKLTPEEFNNLHASQVTKDRVENLKMSAFKIAEHKSVVFKSEVYGDVTLTHIKDDSTMCILIECDNQSVGNYIIY